MMASVTILEQNFDVEYDFDIITHGNNGVAPSLSYAGDPPEAAEFDLEVISITKPKEIEPLEFPNWLKDLILNHLYERDDINQIVQEVDQDRGYDGPDDERE